MRFTVLGRIIAPTVAALALLSAFQSRTPDEEFVAIVKAYFAKNAVADWQGIETLPGITWAPMTSLEKCLPDGSCFARQGSATVGGRKLNVIATGARTIVANIYFRNPAAPLGEAAILEALKKAAVETELARCPVRGSADGTNWYRLTGENLNAGILSVQTSCGGRPCEGIALHHAEELPTLLPAQLALYTEQCAAGADRQPVATLKPHEQLAQTIMSLIPPASAAGYEWQSLPGRSAAITWLGEAPRKTDLSVRKDPNTMSLTGRASFSGRRFSLLASGTPTEVRIIYFEENGLHPRGEHLLGVLYDKGVTVQLVRCGPVYTESTNNWYRLTSASAKPVMLRQSIGHDSNQVNDAYELRLDGTLPARDPRDRNPGVGGCR